MRKYHSATESTGATDVVLLDIQLTGELISVPKNDQLYLLLKRLDLVDEENTFVDR
jgi:hypothetical protein